MTFFLALAQAAVAVVAPPAEGQQGVTSYAPSYFAAQQPATALEMVQRLPGFSVDKGDSVRGFEGAAGNVLIDGRRPASKTDDLEEILRRIPASTVERIDVIRGGAPGIDMQGKSVMANLIKKQGGGVRGQVILGYRRLAEGRDLGAMRLEFSGEKNDRSWEVGLRLQNQADDSGDNGPQVRLDPTGRVIRRSDITGATGNVDHTLTGAYEMPLLGGRLRANARLYSQNLDVAQDNVYSDPASLGAALSDEDRDTRQTELGLRFNRDLNARAALEMIGLRQTKSQDRLSTFHAPTSDREFGNQRDGSETIGRAVLKYRLTDRISLEAGGEAALNTLDSSTQFSIDRVAQTLPAANVSVEEKRGEVFVKGTWRPNSAWNVDAGVRTEFSQITSGGDVALTKSLKFAKPRLSLSWQPAPATQFRVRFERVVGQLNFDDFVASTNFTTGRGVSAGNPDLNPEQAWVGEAAIEQRFWAGVLGVLTVRHFALTDVVDRGPVRSVHRDPATGRDVTEFFDQPTNIGDGTKDELVADLTVPSEGLGWQGGLLKAQLTARRSEVTDPTTGDKREISDLRPLEWTVDFSQDLPRWKISTGVSVISGWREVSYRFDSVETLKLHNAYVEPYLEKRFPHGVAIRVEIHNLTNRGSRTVRAVHAAPRSTGNLLYVDDRDLTQGPSYFIRLRKTLG